MSVAYDGLEEGPAKLLIGKNAFAVMETARRKGEYRNSSLLVKFELIDPDYSFGHYSVEFL